MSISNPEIIVNGDAFAIVPNSWKYTEGTPEANIRAAVIGDSISQDYSEDAETGFSMFSFSVYPTVDNVDRIRALKKSRNDNVVTATGSEIVRGVEKTWRRTFKQAAVMGSTDVPFGKDTVIEISWKSSAAV